MDEYIKGILKFDEGRENMYVDVSPSQNQSVVL